MTRYDVAQVCSNGHVVNWYYKKTPSRNKSFCDRCGSKTITACPACQKEIKGGGDHPIVAAFPPEHPPQFCEHCGKPFPWTQSRIEAAKEWAKEAEELSPEEQTTLANSIDDLVRDTPSTTISAQRFKKLAGKAGKGVLHGFRDILVDVVSETVKKMIFPQ